MSTHQGINVDSVKAEMSKAITTSIAPKLEEMKDHYETIIHGLSYQLTNANERATEAERRVRNLEAWLELASGVKQAVGKTMGATTPSPLKQLEMERDEANARVIELEEEVKRLNVKKEKRKSRDSLVPLKESVC
ncbi:hypothetical protein Moror_2176 [Moniliophthora roreri MCA 2997]|uniref:Uncharacterized protein n=2 Tax=Moniliophthora roreri TaxID=221103 RepID=V2WQ19_MONRO|nr:hypothetical protein Moror_2176 [Moniliophthora roreri MCA 2997]